MAYDEDLANRLRELLSALDGVTEKKMFGGLAFLLHGKLAVSASGRGGLLVRVDPADVAQYLARPHVELMDMGGRLMDGWVVVGSEGLKTRRQLTTWVDRGVRFADSLTPK